MKKIYQTQNKYLWQSLGFSWKDTPVISFVGGGGKSRLIRILSEELSEKKIGHRIFTTTHMWPMAGDAWGKQIGPVDASGKVCPPSEAEMQKIFGERLPVLIEADGSKGRPCKAPEAWEPVLRPETTHVFGVIGASCLGKTIRDGCHRPERVAEILGDGEGPVTTDHRIGIEDLAKLAKSPCGLYKNVTEKQFFGVIINQVDTVQVYEKVRPLQDMLNPENIWFTCLKD